MLLTILFKSDDEIIRKYEDLNLGRRLKINFWYTLLFFLISIIPYFFFNSINHLTYLVTHKLGYIIFIYLIFTALLFWPIYAILRPFVLSSIKKSLTKQSNLTYEKALKDNELNQEKEHTKRLKELEEIEYVRTKGQTDAMLRFYQAQLQLLKEHKQAGLEIEKEAFELQEKLFALESRQNKQMVEDMLRTLENMRK